MRLTISLSAGRQAVPVRGVGVGRAGRGEAVVVGEPGVERPLRKSRVVVGVVVFEDHVRQLQAAAVLHGRALGLALRVEPLGVGVAVVLAPVRA